MSTPPFKVKAVYEYSSPHEDDLSFPNGQVITVTDEEDADWYMGEYTDDQGKQVSGLFPKNFVEKYEPEIPSRPTRPARSKGTVQSPPTQSSEFSGQAEESAPPPPVESKPTPAPVAEPEPEPTPAARQLPPEPVKEEQKPPPTAIDTPPKPKPAQEPAAKKGPPPVAEKPSSFRDRIAAFNKQETPVLPFKPSAPSSNYGIKKPFVAPPPSRNAYVPPPKQEPVQKVYRREEDPEIAQRQAEDQAAAESAGLAVSQELGTDEGEAGEDAPKPQSLKERIALLQRQQAEQAQRRAEGATKEKPKRPSKKRTESSDRLGGEEVDLVESEKSLPVRTSQDAPDTAPARTRSPPPMSPASPREHDILSDGNEADQSAAGETTEANEDTSDMEDLQRKRSIPEPAKSNRAPAAPAQEPDVGDEEDTTEGQSEEDEMDEETRRRMELRERMAKISGGMGMAGMFGPQPGMAIAQPRKSAKSKERKQSRDTEEAPSSPPQPARPMIPVPGMMPKTGGPRSDDTEPAVEKEDELERSITSVRDAEEVPDVEDVRPPPPPKESRKSLNEAERGAPPPVPGDRPVPVPPAASSRPVPPAPPARAPQSPDPSEGPPRSRSSVETPRAPEPPARGGPPPVPGRGSVDSNRSPPPVPGSQISYFPNDAQSEASIPVGSERRVSRGVPPPIPGAVAVGSPPMQSRPPPPPPPAAAPQPVDDPDEGESEYEGDYDTDIASSEKHKAALKTHARQPSLDESTTADDLSVHQSPPQAAMSPPSSHRAVPPPPPPGQAPKGRTSTDQPRNAPPPLPPSRPPPADDADDEGFENYKRYQDSSRGPPPLPPSAAPAPVPVPQQSTQAEDSSDDLYSAPPKRSVDAPRTVPPPPAETSPRPADAARLGGRQSLDAARTLNRKSMEGGRPSTSHDFIATDLDLSESTQWWAQPNTPPPAIQGRTDVLYEIEESTTSKRGGKTTVSKDVYVLFHDYSQTVVTAQFDRANPSDLLLLEQRHEPPPPKLRQDQLEAAWQSFGAKIADAAAALEKRKDNAAVGDGTAAALPLELIRTAAGPTALLPVGTRAYGAPVYANQGATMVAQFDEIRPGDCITFRAAKLQGKHGLKTVNVEVGALTGAGGQGAQQQGHVAVVVEWDGTKKKVRALEQSRDEKGRTKVKEVSYRLGDLKSGEVRVWRVVGRSWVGWDGGK